MAAKITAEQGPLALPTAPPHEASISAPRIARTPTSRRNSGPSEDLPHGYESPIRLWRRGTKPKTGRMERFLRALGISGRAYTAWAGGQSLKAFGASNPTWTQRAWEVLIVENLEMLRQFERGEL